MAEQFLSTPSARRATSTGEEPVQTSWAISIHALREEGDLCVIRHYFSLLEFLSTPSARRATSPRRQESLMGRISTHAPRESGYPSGCRLPAEKHYFYPPPPLGGRRDRCRNAQAGYRISIHALREEGDVPTSRPKRTARVFLSTPSARRATEWWRVQDGLEAISIHALREEGDKAGASERGCALYFYPRPPRGGRHKILDAVCRVDGISIHALREEGDLTLTALLLFLWIFLSTPSARRATTRRTCRATTAALFLSTPSARRATAKTETKSLFSNKLYNILHEFRRALIYNGSKNYPNHAK